MIVVDAHMHIWDRIDGRIGDDRVVPTENGKTLIGDAEVLMMPPGFTDSRVPAETALAYFDDAGVHVGVVVQEYMDGSQNEYLVDVMGRHSDRFFCHALLDFFSPAACLAEYGRVKAMGFRGVKVPAGHLFAADPRVRIDDPGIMRVCAAMEADGMVLSVDLAEGDAQVAELANIARAHPGLSIVLGHFAMANRPGWMAQLRLCKLPNVYVESGGICWLFRDEGIEFAGAQEAIRTARDEVGADKIMWGSDLPRTMVDFTYRQLLDFARYGCEFFTADEKAAFLGGNAARVYGLDLDVAPREPLPLITA
jgi:hypothetical protein